MPLIEYSFTNFGTANTSTGTVVINARPTVLHTININSSGTGTMTFYNATTSSTGAEIAVLTVGVPNVLEYDAVLSAGLTRGQTTSTADITVTWA